MSGIIVSALVEQDGCLLMVRERLPGEQERWVVPGGVAEPGELAHHALVREVDEETGLTLAGSVSLACISQHLVAGDPGWDGTWTVLTFRAESATGTLGARDPDELVLEAAWVPIDEAVARLEAHPSRRRREPLISCLDGTSSPGALWLWPGGPADPPIVVPPATVPPRLERPVRMPGLPVLPR